MKPQIENIPPATPTRRLSPWRVLLALIMLALIGYGGYKAVNNWQEMQKIPQITPWFAPYVDVTSTPRYAFEQLGDTPVKNVVLAFIVSSPENACTPTWGGYYTLNEASKDLDLDRRIARYRQQGGNIVVSFGGLLNDELAVKCTSHHQLSLAYKSIIDRYQIDTIDLDLEGEGLSNIEALKRRAEVIAGIQQQQRAENKHLAVWLTLPVAPFGMTEQGTTAIAEMLAAGVDIAGINIMTMDYGQSKDPNHTMQQASERAAIQTHRQLGILYQQAGINLNSASLWKKIGVTPMIGQNDVLEEIFTLDDATGFNAFAQTNGIVRMSMWSANRDIQCGENYVNTSIVSDSCSGIEQNKMDFTARLAAGFEGLITLNAGVITESDTDVMVEQTDVPEESPYQIWNEKAVYLEGTKVVWHRNVYQAKWWTTGDLPDNPVLQTWETPWQLLGPVLPGEKPIPQPTLPAGTYPEWQGLEIYEAGQRVLFEGTPYQAKWWTQGDSPAASTSDQESSPWIMLTQHQIEQMLTQLQAAGLIEAVPEAATESATEASPATRM